MGVSTRASLAAIVIAVLTVVILAVFWLPWQPALARFTTGWQSHETLRAERAIGQPEIRRWAGRLTEGWIGSARDLDAPDQGENSFRFGPPQVREEVYSRVRALKTSYDPGIRFDGYVLPRVQNVYGLGPIGPADEIFITRVLDVWSREKELQIGGKPKY
jgi:hypothetical protein